MKNYTRNAINFWIESAHIALDLARMWSHLAEKNGLSNPEKAMHYDSRYKECINIAREALTHAIKKRKEK